jgi:hypothetical protein
MSKKLDPKMAEKVMLKAGLRPLEPYVGSINKWRCVHIACGQIVSPSYHQIKRGQGGCINCGKKRTANSHRIPENIAVQMMLDAKLKPKVKFPGAKKPWKSECLKCKKIVSPSYSAIRNGQGGCKYCANKFIDPKDAVRIMKIGGFKTLEPYKGAGKPWKSSCIKCGLISTPTFANVQNGSGCTVCKNANKPKPTKITSSQAIKIMTEAKLQPLEPYLHSKKPWKSRCMVCKKITYPTLGNVKKTITPCVYCSDHKVDPKDAVRVMKKAKLQPLEDFVSVQSKWKCICMKCGEIVSPVYAGIQQGQGGCYKCGKIQMVKNQLLGKRETSQIMTKAKLKPLEPYRGMKYKWKCKCLVCEQVVYPTFSNVYNGHNGCRYCAPAGFNMYGESYIYLISHPTLYAHKIGIGNVKKNMDRLGRFNSKGWETYKVWKFNTGREVIDLESRIFKHIRNELKLPIYLSYDQMKSTGGHAETVGADSITLLELEKIIKKVIKGYH